MDQSDRFAIHHQGPWTKETASMMIFNIWNVKPGYMTPHEEQAAQATLSQMLGIWRGLGGGDTIASAIAYYKKWSGGKTPFR